MIVLAIWIIHKINIVIAYYCQHLYDHFGPMEMYILLALRIYRVRTKNQCEPEET